MSEWEEYEGVRLGRMHYELTPPEPGDLAGLLPITGGDGMAIIVILPDGTAEAGPGDIYSGQLKLAERWWRARTAST